MDSLCFDLVVKYSGQERLAVGDCLDEASLSLLASELRLMAAAAKS